MRKATKAVSFVGYGLLCLAVGLTVGSLTTTISLLSTGRLVTVNLTCSLSEIDWGRLYPDSAKSVPVLVTSTSTGTNISLTLSTQNFSPIESEQYLNLTWDREGTILAPGESVNATLALHVSPLIENTTSFEFDIVLSGMEIVGD